MPGRDDLEKVLIIGSGPVVIGQACKALREEGYEIVLVNSNPATIMTDPGMAARTYVEPLTIERGEDRIAFKATMASPDIPVPRSGPCHSVEEAERIAAELNYPVVLRPAYAMGGHAGEIRAQRRIRGGETRALGLREVSPGRGPAGHPDARGRRSDGHGG